MFRIGTLPGMIALAIVALSLDTATARGQSVPWRYDYNAARREAREKGRPIILDFGTHDCVYCRKLDEITFRDPAVARMLSENFIPIKIDADRDAPLARALHVDSYPTLVFAAPDGKILGSHEGFADAAAFAKQLQNILATFAAAPLPNGPGLATGQFAPPAAEKARLARELLALAREDYRTQQYLCCLERCRALAVRYAELPEATEAQQLAARVRSDPEAALQACANLTDSLGELYLGLADSWLRAGQPRQAMAALERAVQTCPGTRHAQMAQQRLAQLRDEASRPPAPVVRTQAP